MSSHHEATKYELLQGAGFGNVPALGPLWAHLSSFEIPGLAENMAAQVDRFFFL